MSTTSETKIDHYGVTSRYHGIPKVDSWDDAVSFVEYVLQQIGTYPETVTACNLDGIPPSCLAGQQPATVSELREQLAGHAPRYTLTRGQALKARAVWREVITCLEAINAMPRIPLEMALRFDSGAVTPLWGERVLQVIPEGEPSE